MSQRYIHGQKHAPDQRPTLSFYDSSFEGSQNSFPSNLSTHPPTCFPPYASDPDSGSTSELEFARAASFRTPSTPANSSNGEFDDFLGDASPFGYQSPSYPDRTLQGISGSNYDASLCDWESSFNSNSIYDSSYFNHPGTQNDYANTISAQIPARKDISRLLRSSQSPRAFAEVIYGPWSQENRCYQGQSRPGDSVEEGGVFHESVRDNVYLSQPMLRTWQDHGQQRGLGNNTYRDPPQHSRSSNSSQDYLCRQNDITYSSSPSSSSSANAGSPASATTVAARKTGGRTGPLSDAARRNAEKMRKRGCCYRCFIMKEKCILNERIVGDQICQRCQTIMYNSRTWDLPCTQIGLDERAKFVVPGFLRDQLKGPTVDAFLNDHVDRFLARPSIVLHLTMGFGESLRVDAVEVVLKNEQAVCMRGVSPPDRGSISLVKLNSPPLLPHVVDRIALQRKFNRCLDSTVEEPDSNFPYECFPEAHEHWPREILRIIFKYFQALAPDSKAGDSGPYDTLRRALKLVVFNHMMCHPWVVPEEEIERLYRQLRGRYTFDKDEWVCPRMANKVIKAILLPMLDKLATRILTDLQRLLRKKGNDETLWDPLFCTIFLCLVVVGKFQVSFLERVALGLANNDFSFLEAEAKSGISEMEEELSRHLIGQFHARFGTNRKGNGNGKMFNPLSRDGTSTSSRLAQEVGFATRVYGAVSTIETTLMATNGGAGSHTLKHTDPPHHSLGAMKETNVTRLLASFMEHFV